MDENKYRVLLGVYLIATLATDNAQAMFVFVAWMALEALTNIRGTSVYNKIMSPKQNSFFADKLNAFDSERVLRAVLVIILLPLAFHQNSVTWVIPWFVAIMLISAGISQICPMKMIIAKLGFK